MNFVKSMNLAKPMIVAGVAAAAFGTTLLLAQANLGHGDAPAGVPMKTTYDVSSLKFTRSEEHTSELQSH